MRVCYLTSILSTVVHVSTAGVPLQAMDSSDMTMNQSGNFPTTCGCQTCPCGGAVPICVKGVCHNATPKLKRKLFSRKKEVRFYTEPKEGLRQKWRNHRDQRYIEKSRAVMATQSQNASSPVVTVAQPSVGNCNDCTTDSCVGCKSSKLRRRNPPTYRVETKVKRNHWWNRDKATPVCSGSACTIPIVQVVSSDATLLPVSTPLPVITSLSVSNSTEVSQVKSVPTVAVLDPIPLPTLLSTLSKESGTIKTDNDTKVLGSDSTSDKSIGSSETSTEKKEISSTPK